MPRLENYSPVNVIDTTLRDGVQNPEMPEHGKYSLTLPEKIEIFTALVKYGVRHIEVFSPLVNAAERESLSALVECRNQLAPTHGYAFILGHVRCDERDIQAAIDAGVDGLNVYMGTSQESRQNNHGKDLQEVARRARTTLEGIRQQYPHLQLRFSGEDSFRTPLRDLYTVYDGIAETVDRFGMPDTVGVATPDLVRRRVRAISKRYPHVSLEGHFHNDRGLSLINAVTAVLAGMQYIDTSVLGLAERSGITSLTGLLFNLYLEEIQQLKTSEVEKMYTLEDSYTLNVLVASIMKMQVPFSEPISLTNNTHSAGVHTSAMLRSSRVYQAHPLAKFGVAETRLLLGPLSGWHVVHYYLTHVLNYENVTDELAKKISILFKDKCSNGSSEENPTTVLRQIAEDYGLQKKVKPITHIEKL